jgi:penicillin amidase
MVELLQAPDDEGFAVFGLTGAEVARHLLDVLVEKDAGLVMHSVANRWRAQHPFVGRVPLIGRLFAVDEPLQWGAFDTVEAEQPTMGPSMRLVWDLRHPAESTWSFPVGQSGHVASPFYRNWQPLWADGASHRVFSDPVAWGLASGAH